MLVIDPGRLQQWQGSAGGYGIRPYGAGAMLVIPNKSLKQKIPEQTFEDFGAVVESQNELFCIL